MAEPLTFRPAAGVKLVKNVMIPMRDGVRLAVDLYMPDGAEASRDWNKFSVVMDYLPYRKDEVNPSTFPHYLYLPRHGYVVARVDIRGTGASEGVNVDEYTVQEQEDGYDAIEWLSAQDWCDGHVNMMGISYGGFTALQVASHAPPHLTSIIPVDFTDDRYTDDCHYRGGLVRKYYDIGWYGGRMIAWGAMPPYPDWSGEDWAKVWEQHLAMNEPYLLKWYNHQTDGPYWRNGSVRDIPESIKCPTFLIGGWRDGYPNPPLRLYEALKVPKKALIGPWNHSMPDAAIPGPRVDYLKEVVRWLDYWCKGLDTGIMAEPPLAVYMMRYEEPVVDRLDAAGEWRAETHWPAPGLTEKPLYLAEGGALADAPGSNGQAEYDYRATVGVTGGLWSGGLQYGMPGDQRPDEAFSLNYTTPPLAEDLPMLGWAHAILHLSSTATVMGFAASLSEVGPDGTSHLVAKGMLNGTRRNSFETPEAMTPGETYELDIQIDCTGWTFSKGNRIRLSIASADWPNVWPTPELGQNTIYHGTARPSRLVLPVVPVKASAQPPKLDPSSKVMALHATAIEPPIWKIVNDVLTGRQTADILYRLAFRVNETTVIHREWSSVCQVDPKDPAHATVRGWHVCDIERPNSVMQGRTDVMVQATASHFHMTIDLTLTVNGAPHFTKRWVESIPRELL